MNIGEVAVIKCTDEYLPCVPFAATIQLESFLAVGMRPLYYSALSSFLSFLFGWKEKVYFLSISAVTNTTDFLFNWAENKASAQASVEKSELWCKVN